MNTRWRLTNPLLGALLACFACTEPTSPPAAPGVRAELASPANGGGGFTITDLGTLGGAFGEARAINDAGQVVGAAATASGEPHAFLWSATDGMKDLGTLGGSFSRAFAINHRGHVAGVAALPSGERRPFLWTPEGGMQDLGTFGGGFGRARGINNQDQVVGVSTVPGGATHAFLWTTDKGLTDLVAVVGDNSEAFGINDRQQVAGGSPFGPCVFTIPFLWSAREGYRSLGQLGTADPCGGAVANAVNENDEAVGLAENDAFVVHAFRWTAGSGMVDIGTLFGPSGTSVAFAVNARGQIAGFSVSADGSTQNATVWDNHGEMQDLGTFPGDVASLALGINARGQIVGISVSANIRAVLWTPQELVVK
jgi:probable HAF family extracellular repeat protein